MKDEFHDWFCDEYLEGQHWFDKCPINKVLYIECWFILLEMYKCTLITTSVWNLSLSVEPTFK